MTATNLSKCLYTKKISYLLCIFLFINSSNCQAEQNSDNKQCITNIDCGKSKPYCVSGICKKTQCSSFQDCNGFTQPYCSNGMCQECLNSNTCVNYCSSSNDCPSYQPFCNLFKCSNKQCVSSFQCGGSTPFCNLSNFTCQSTCLSNLDCFSKQMGIYCFNGQCGNIECLNFSDCSGQGSNYYCKQGECKNCPNQKCNIQCINGQQCPSFQPYCIDDLCYKQQCKAVNSNNGSSSHGSQSHGSSNHRSSNHRSSNHRSSNHESSSSDEESCNVDPDCPCGKFCNSGHCSNLCISDAQCQRQNPTYTCNGGQCGIFQCQNFLDCENKGLTNYYCDSNQTCKNCDNPNCQISCVNSQCPFYQPNCFDNQCYKEICLNDSHCSPSEFCINNVCTSECTTDEQCQTKNPNHFCYQNQCGPIQCQNFLECQNKGFTNYFCNQNNVCENCENPNCTMTCFNGLCPFYQPNCFDNQCYKEICLNDSHCSPSEFCINNVCTSECTTDEQCQTKNPNHFCYQNQCGPIQCQNFLECQNKGFTNYFCNQNNVCENCENPNCTMTCFNGLCPFYQPNCFDNQCYKEICLNDSHCSPSEFCINNVCTSECTTDEQCQTKNPNHFCYQNQCGPIQCQNFLECQNKGFTNYFCNQNNVCENCENPNCTISCVNSECPFYQQYCFDNQCYKEICLNDSHCNSNQFCINNLCTTQCSSDAQCQTKNPNHFCYQNQCGTIQCQNFFECQNKGFTNYYCDSNQTCKNCDNPDCDISCIYFQCPFFQPKCFSGKCSKDFCKTDLNCAYNEFCINGSCTDTCTSTIQCQTKNENYECINNKCDFPPPNFCNFFNECENQGFNNYYCNDLTHTCENCEAPNCQIQCFNNSCPPHQAYCQADYCFQCLNDSHCSPSEFCVNNKCTTECSSDAMCQLKNADYICENNQCVPSTNNNTCSNFTQCSNKGITNYYCDANNTCQDCPNANCDITCVNSTCPFYQPNCLENKCYTQQCFNDTHCPSDKFCLLSSGTCITKTTPCTSSSQCQSSPNIYCLDGFCTSVQCQEWNDCPQNSSLPIHCNPYNKCEICSDVFCPIKCASSGAVCPTNDFQFCLSSGFCRYCNTNSDCLALGNNLSCINGACSEQIENCTDDDWCNNNGFYGYKCFNGICGTCFSSSACRQRYSTLPDFDLYFCDINTSVCEKCTPDSVFAVSPALECPIECESSADCPLIQPYCHTNGWCYKQQSPTGYYYQF